MTHAISLARIQANFGCSEAVGPCLAELVRCSRADEGCLGYELQCGGGHDTWMLRGEWASEQALMAHLQQPHLQVLGQLLAGGLVRHLALHSENMSSPESSYSSGVAL